MPRCRLRQIPQEGATTAELWTVVRGADPLVATAIHAGHELRPDVAKRLLLSEADRLREEDPYTDRWSVVAGNRIVPRRSRFEVDLNRSRGHAVYAKPEDAWGLELWREPLPTDVQAESLAVYDMFYGTLHALLRDLERRHGGFVLLDLHSYNHRRGGPGGPDDDPAGNPDVNVGTGSMDRSRWGPLVDRFLTDLSRVPFPLGHRGVLDVRENVRFRGGHLSRWVHETFPETGCALALEFKKIFMDEWTGEPWDDVIDAEVACLSATADGLRASLAACRNGR